MTPKEPYDPASPRGTGIEKIKGMAIDEVAVNVTKIVSPLAAIGVAIGVQQPQLQGPPPETPPVNTSPVSNRSK
jgi:hypothetical protein